MSNLEKSKEIVRENFMHAQCGIFSCRNIVGDQMSCLYCDENLEIEICYEYEYFEVFGLTPEEFDLLSEYYYAMRKDLLGYE